MPLIRQSFKEASRSRDWPFQQKSMNGLVPDSQRNGVELTSPVLDVTLVERKRTRPRVLAILHRHEITGLQLYQGGVAIDIAIQLDRQYNCHFHTTEFCQQLHGKIITLR